MIANARDQPPENSRDTSLGTGEHARFLTSKGFDVTGVDTSPAMLEKSRAAGGRFVEGDMRDFGALFPDERFGGAPCVGNAHT